jgi:dipeptidase D
MFRYLKHAATKHGLRLASIDGGSLRNAIPREAFAVVLVPADRAAKLPGCVAEYESIFKKELSVTEPDLKFGLAKTDMPAFVIDQKTQTQLTNAIYACPNGVIRMSDSLPGLVETSTNLAIVKSEDGTVKVCCLMRSSVDTAKDDLGIMVESVFQLAGADIVLDGSYPGWKPNPDSAILKVMLEVYKNKYGKIPDIKAIHAGLECGILSTNYPHWDMISFGPTIRFPHSPDEKVNIATVGKFYDYLVETLKNIPAK